MEVEATRERIGVEAGINGVKQKLLAVHGAGTLVGRVAGGAHPLEVTAYQTIYLGAHVGSLRMIAWANKSAGDGNRQLLGRHTFECGVDVREMAAVKFIEIMIVGGVVLGPIPPVPVTAFRDEQLFPRELALRLGNAIGVTIVGGSCAEFAEP